MEKHQIKLTREDVGNGSLGNKTSEWVFSYEK